MKNKTIGFAVFLVAVFAFIACTTNDPSLSSTKTAGTLTISTTTSATAGGVYIPHHVVAIWVEDYSGKFVKTLLVKAQQRIGYLSNWENSSSGNTVDAITGATINTHGSLTCSWNGTDVNGKMMNNGTYSICMELTDKDATGNFSKFSIKKDSVITTSTPANVASFSSVSLKWTPK
jgi:hypothetical protein